MIGGGVKALITGSQGFLGGHMCARLFDDGWTITPIDINAKNIHSRQDAREFFSYSDTKYDLVVHCAAHVGGRQDIENRAAYIGAYNLQLDGALFEWALRTRPAHIIYWSSSAAYPVHQQTSNHHWAGYRLQEVDIYLDAPEPADATYGWVKLVGERLAAEARAEGVNIHVLRPFSGWDADQSTDYPMGAFLDRARRKADPFQIWGDGEQVRDFIHVDDVVAAALAVVEQDHPGPLNLCTGIGTSFNQLAELVCKSAGYSPQIQHRLNSPVGVRYRVGDPSEMLKVYQPKISLEEGVRDALQAD
jgi:nucleoside-diphosphate-sugar epimerase